MERDCLAPATTTNAGVRFLDSQLHLSELNLNEQSMRILQEIHERKEVKFVKLKVKSPFLLIKMFSVFQDGGT